MKNRIRILCTATLLLALTSCQSALFPSTRELTLRTAATKENCFSQVRECFRVYTLPDNMPYGLFSVSEIKGFTYQEGYESTILVSVTEVKNPPADASSLDFTLIRVIDHLEC